MRDPVGLEELRRIIKPRYERLDPVRSVKSVVELVAEPWY